MTATVSASKRTDQLRMTRHERLGDLVVHAGTVRRVRTTSRNPVDGLMAVEFVDGVVLTTVPRDQVWVLVPEEDLRTSGPIG